jgi:hypothetical protein
VVDCDEQLLMPLLLEVSKCLLPNIRDYLDEFASLMDLQILFQQINTTAYTFKDIACQNFGSFCWYLIDAEICSCALIWWQKKKQKFPTMATLAS